MTNEKFLHMGGILRNNHTNPMCAIIHWRGTYEFHSGDGRVGTFDSWESIPAKLQNMIAGVDRGSAEHTALTELLARIQD